MNSALKKLGFSDQDRVVIIHTDDIGMFQSTIPAYNDLLVAGLVSAASTMVPCPWFLEAARYCQEHSDKVDMGVHLTLNAEWNTYRWGPISTRDPQSGLMDEQGYFFADPAKTTSQANLEAVRAELKAQIERALAAGIDITHVDSHMATLLSATFLQTYVEVALEYQLPPFLLKNMPELAKHAGATAEEVSHLSQLLNEMEEQGVPIFDAVAMLPLDDPHDHISRAQEIIDNLQPGLTYMILHPSVDSAELRAAAPDWQSRVANYQALSSPVLYDYVKQSGVQLIGYRPLRELLRSIL